MAHLGPQAGCAPPSFKASQDPRGGSRTSLTPVPPLSNVHENPAWLLIDSRPCPLRNMPIHFNLPVHPVRNMFTPLRRPLSGGWTCIGTTPRWLVVTPTNKVPRRSSPRSYMENSALVGGAGIVSHASFSKLLPHCSRKSYRFSLYGGQQNRSNYNEVCLLVSTVVLNFDT